MKTRIFWSAALLAVLTSVAVVAAAAAPTDPPYPSRIDFPAPTIDPVTGAVTTNFSPEGMAVSGDNFYAGSTATGEIIKGNLKTGAYQRNWVPASPAQPNDLHRGVLGLLVDSQNRLWAATSYGMACNGTTTLCPAGVTAPQVNYGILDVYNADSGAHLAQYTLTAYSSKTMNDMTIANNAVFLANTTAPCGAGTELQFELPLGAGGALPPGDVPPAANVGGGNHGAVCPNPSATPPVVENLGPVNPAMIRRPTSGFVSSDGVDTLPNGNVLFASVSGNPVAGGQMIEMDSTTGAFTYITVTNEPGRNPALPPLLSLDGVTLDGNMLYAPENRTDTATCPSPNNTLSCPGDWAAIALDPPTYTTGHVVTRLNSPAGSGLPPLRSPANMEQLGHSVYGITRQVVANPVTGANNVTLTFIERLDKVAASATGSAVSAVEGAAFSGTIGSISDPNNGPIAANSYTQQGTSNYGYTTSTNWGDGSSSSTGTVAGGTSTITGSHTYHEEGTYTVTTTVADAATTAVVATATSTATVADAPLTAGLIKTTCGSGPCGVSFRFTDANSFATTADFTATINWGDGTLNTAGVVAVAAPGPGFVVTGSHAYADDGGGHMITVTVNDDGGSTTTKTTSASSGKLTPDANGFDNGNPQSVVFTVSATCSAGSTATAWINGVPVNNGDSVRLKQLKDGDQSVKWQGDRLSIDATSFELVVVCTDAAGNTSATATSPAFSPPGGNGNGNGNGNAPPADTPGKGPKK